MNYPLENLDPERFQQLCQALLVAELPGVSCYPVGMPDGGRDATRRIFSDEANSFVVYQVKFSRTLKEQSEVYDWVLAAATREAEKARRLKARGATRYIFITNAPGTSHLDGGSMDRLYAELSGVIDLPVECWWRDDINRRLDGNWNIKLRYPDVLTGQDFLRLLLSTENKEDQDRRANALRGFLGDQYQEDQDVKFKQVELQNKLLDLFVDLPFRIEIRDVHQAPKWRALGVASLDIKIDERTESITISDQSERESAGTASILLSEMGCELLPQIVVEGAPGQGKSTLAQYLCQVHRIRILNKVADLEVLPLAHRQSPVFVPFKIDLRDLSEWISGADPFNSTSETREGTDRTVEAFLARLVSHKAGGFSFSVNDLVQVAKITPLFLAFDGLDEVADIKRRADVVFQISKTLARFRENCPNIRAIITSRPAAFANSPGFEAKSFPYLQLGSVRRLQIKEYAEKWMDARALSDKERQEFEEILEEKLDQPHLRDLSRNPMQLTILLSLIHTKGAALPDKRTALYDAYVELFFSRESTKNSVVRTHLDLLKDIHRYLAWILHSRAELGRGAGTDGRLTSSELKAELESYLQKELQSTAVIDEVFSAMLERVVMIVSRIQGTYEFEVQPLREYFAARYLYDTASYSPPGGERSGTKPDRFDAIAKNRYWLNVLRFFCGCFSKGELLDLADRVKELNSDPVAGAGRYPVQLLAMLLSDWVFTQSQRALADVVASLLSRSALRRLIPAEINFRMEEPVRIPSACGNEIITKKALDFLLDPKTRSDVGERISRFIVVNNSPQFVMDAWLENIPSSEKDFGHWLRCGSYSGVLDALLTPHVQALITDRPLTPLIIRTLWNAGHAKAIAVSADGIFKLKEFAFCRSTYWRDDGAAAPFYLMPIFHRIWTCLRVYEGSFGEVQREILDGLEKFKAVEGFDDSELSSHLKDFSRLCYKVSKAVADRICASPELLENSSLWEFIAGHCAEVFGDAPLFSAMSIAILDFPGGRKGRAKKVSIFDLNEPIVTRLRYVKSKSKQWEFWSDLISIASTSNERALVQQALWAWAPSALILENNLKISSALDSLPTEEWDCFAFFYSTFPSRRRRMTQKGRKNVALLNTLSARFAFLMAQREVSNYGRQVFLSHFMESTDDNEVVQHFRYFNAMDAAFDGELSWSSALSIVKDSSDGGHYFDAFHEKKMPIQVAEEILRNPEYYPAGLWDRVQVELAARDGKYVKPVALIARKDRWFLD